MVPHHRIGPHRRQRSGPDRRSLCVITTVDGLMGRQLDAQPESIQQVAVADRLVLRQRNGREATLIATLLVTGLADQARPKTR